MKSTRDGLTKRAKSVDRGELRGRIRRQPELSKRSRWYGKGAASIASGSTDWASPLDCLLLRVKRAYREEAWRLGAK
jgi:hypothetical protein